MAVNTLARLRVLLLAVVIRVVISAGEVALAAEVIARYFDLATMRVMTVCAAYALLIHFALQKRAKDKNLVFNLSIGEIKARAQQPNDIFIVIGCTGHMSCNG